MMTTHDCAIDAHAGHKPEAFFILNRKIPIAVLFMLVAQLIVWVWGGAVFYTNQQNIAAKFEQNFDEINTKFEKIEASMFSRQEAAFQLDAMRQTDQRQEQDIRQLSSEFRQLLLKRAIGDGSGTR